MNIDARVAELEHSDIPDKQFTLLLNLHYVYFMILFDTCLQVQQSCVNA